jgi:hypothetical protein
MRIAVLFLILCTSVFAGSAPIDSANYVLRNGEKLKDDTHVLQVTFVQEAGARDSETSWLWVCTSQSVNPTGEILAVVRNEDKERVLKKYGTEPSPRRYGEPYKRRPLKARVRWNETKKEAFLEIESILLTP